MAAIAETIQRITRSARGIAVVWEDGSTQHFLSPEEITAYCERRISRETVRAMMLLRFLSVQPEASDDTAFRGDRLTLDVTADQPTTRTRSR